MVIIGKLQKLHVDGKDFTVIKKTCAGNKELQLKPKMNFLLFKEIKGSIARMCPFTNGKLYSKIILQELGDMQGLKVGGRQYRQHCTNNRKIERSSQFARCCQE